VWLTSARQILRRLAQPEKDQNEITKGRYRIEGEEKKEADRRERSTNQRRDTGSNVDRPVVKSKGTNSIRYWN
jgi:hypothetical protein